MSALYDNDIVEWSARQAQLLRGLAARQPSNEAPDWANIIEELESVGRSQVQAVESLLLRAFVHDLEVRAWPCSWSVPHWEAEARVFRRDARRKLTPSMRQKIDVAGLFQDALEGLPETMDGYLPAKEELALASLTRPPNLDAALTDPGAARTPP